MGKIGLPYNTTHSEGVAVIKVLQEDFLYFKMHAVFFHSKSRHHYFFGGEWGEGPQKCFLFRLSCFGGVFFNHCCSHSHRRKLCKESPSHSWDMGWHIPTRKNRE